MSARRGPGTHDVAGLPLDEPHLVDTSAWSKARNQPNLAAQFEDSARRGHVATCELVALELLRSAQNHERFNRQTSLLATLRTCPVGQAELQRARGVQAELAAVGQQRGVKPVDLLIAAAGEAAGLPILHYDHDYDIISSITGQPTRWLAEPGSLP